MKRALYTLIVTILAVFTVSCNLQPVKNGENINDYIYPYLEFTPDEDGEGYTVTVVDGAELETIYVPAEVSVNGTTVPVTSFSGFQNPDNAGTIKNITFESSSTVLTDKAAEQTGSLVNVRVETVEPESKWGYLPPVEKEGKEFIGWFIEGTSVQVFEGDTITNPVIEPRFRDHSLVKHEGKAATCTSPGWDEYVTCTTCSYTTFREIPKLSHSLTHHEEIAATCTTDGRREYWSCSNCSGFFSESSGTNRIDTVIITALGHSLTHIEKKEAACGRAGMAEYWKCTRCSLLFADSEGKTIAEEENLIIEALEHNYVRTQYSAEYRCTWKECTLCHETTDPAGHSWDEGRIHKEATATESGIMRYTCLNSCGITKDEDIAPDNTDHQHDWRDKEPKERTCTERGYTVRICTICSAEYSCNYIDAEGHRTVLVEEKEPTCTEDGNSRYYRCEVCDGLFRDTNGINTTTEAEIREGREKKRHSYSSDYTEKEGYHCYTCTLCGDESGKEEHTYNRKRETTEYEVSCATCTSAAVYRYSCICGRAGDTTFESGSALGHSLRHHTEEKATCIQAGRREYWECTRPGCGRSYFDRECTDEVRATDDLIIGKTEHTDSGEYTTAGDRGHQKKCSYCKSGYGDYITHTVQYFEWGGNDSRTHWHICRYCEYRADEEKHTMEKFGSDTVCTVCGYTEKEEETTGGAFSIKPGSSEPTGTLTVTGGGMEHRAVFTPDRGITVDRIEWYLDNRKAGEGVYSCDFDTPDSRTYTIMCVIYSGITGNSYDRKIYGGNSR